MVRGRRAATPAAGRRSPTGRWTLGSPRRPEGSGCWKGSRCPAWTLTAGRGRWGRSQPACCLLPWSCMPTREILRVTTYKLVKRFWMTDMYSVFCDLKTLTFLWRHTAPSLKWEEFRWKDQRSWFRQFLAKLMKLNIRTSVLQSLLNLNFANDEDMLSLARNISYWQVTNSRLTGIRGGGRGRAVEVARGAGGKVLLVVVVVGVGR